MLQKTVGLETISLLAADELEVERQLKICNACRYCEGFCAVFPAMTRRLEFTKPDIHYMANLCHNCGACLYACQYATPHEFAVNIPKSMAKVRLETYKNYTWPLKLSGLYQRNGVFLSLALCGGILLFLLMTLFATGSLFPSISGGNFYDVFKHELLVKVFGAVFLISVLILVIALCRFWCSISPVSSLRDTEPNKVDVICETTDSILRLKYLDGGHGKGCNNENDQFTLWRRNFHHMTFYGFMLCLASTGVGTIYHYFLGWVAPYALTSIPVVLGTLGGVGLLMGPIGLLWLNLRRNSEQGDSAQIPMDRGFIVLLILMSSSGLALLAFRETQWMAILLAAHLATVMAFFIAMPYSKFVHGFFRGAALFKYMFEKRLPDNLRLGGD